MHGAPCTLSFWGSSKLSETENSQEQIPSPSEFQIDLRAELSGVCVPSRRRTCNMEGVPKAVCRALAAFHGSRESSL